ncbi:MAG: P-loop NTPase [Lachnospiraceae bacterium]
MSEKCTHNCDSCGANCGDRNTLQKGANSFLKAPHPESKIKYVIGVASGKGGVGKSTVTALIATMLQKRGYQTAILDADVTGPSIPKVFGVHGKAEIVEGAMYPVFTHTGIQIMSTNLILDQETDPVVWRGPIVAGVVQQFWTDVVWTDVDVMLIDMPPGTGDVPLTVYQSIPLDGLVVVTSPQQLVSMIVEKAIHMSEMMDIPLLGLVENDSYYICPDCGKKHFIYGESKLEETAAQFGIENVVRLPILPKLAEDFDQGEAESFDCNLLGKEIHAFLDKMMEFENC